MAEYGIPYMGSKSSICNGLIKIFPKADHFYDLFGGGFSVTHSMLLRRSKHYKQFHFNEIRPGICELIQDAIAGKYSDDKFKPPFVSREEFFEKKNKDPYVKMIWSFGNGGNNYLFSKEIEPYKRSMHNAIIFNTFDELARKTLKMSRFKEGYSVKDKRLVLRNRIEFYRKTKVPEFLWRFLKEKDLAIIKNNKQVDHLKQLQQLERLEQLEQLEQLQRLERLEQLTFYSTSYDKVPIKDNSIIYCDPPYLGTAEYDNKFDHKKFYDWCDAQKNPVFISEYNIPDKRFTPVFKIKKRSLLAAGVHQKDKMEKMYVNRMGLI